ncbi:MAG: hypothetical protein JXB32_10970 [Deltaproteobacteria bacterium]|nr:hypothetical protein [Deltaproteobacteria bacterium]
MPSNALGDFAIRLKEVEQLLEAHGALVALKNAQAAAQAGGGLKQLANVVNALVAKPGPGKPPQVQAINKAAFAMLSAHLQGFVTDLYKEAARHLLDKRVPDLATVLAAADAPGNPNPQNIIRLFGRIGFSDVLAGVSWQKMNNQARRAKLREFIERRNRIVHGRSESVWKAEVEAHVKVWRNFAGRLDERVRLALQAVKGKSPW